MAAKKKAVAKKKGTPQQATTARGTPKKAAVPRPLAKLRKICLALPGSHEVEAWGSATFRTVKIFAMASEENSHAGGHRPSVWLKAAPGNQSYMVAAAPARFFVPPYVGPSGWIGVWLDDKCDWDELAELVKDSWSLTAPKKLLKQGK
ncbi:MAG: hypothetical protein JWO05_2894 [Gemmatimonadetes bacterium]|nr:hypothetical protein [Gemmatimonadota bacterium]